MKRTAFVQGASRGIGHAMVKQLLAEGWHVVGTCRDPARADALRALAAKADSLRVLPLDVSVEASIENFANEVASIHDRLHLLINVAGVLHTADIAPEKKLEQVSPRALSQVFAVNAFGPLLVAKHFAPFLIHRERAVLANVSARVGSIGDNRLGGWYAYRASKAAQNMFTKNLSIELARRAKHLSVIALHPGTVSTELSAPFTRRRSPDSLFSVERAAAQLLTIMNKVTPEQSGQFFAWDGTEIPW